MAKTIRSVHGPEHRFNLWSTIVTMWMDYMYSTRGLKTGAIVGTVTAGELDAAANVVAHIDGVPFTFDYDGTSASWDLSEEVDLAAGQYRAYWLYSTALSVASIAAGAVATTPELAVAALPNPVDDKAILGVYVAGDDTNAIDFSTDTLGATGYGTVYNGLLDCPAGTNIGVESGGLIPPQALRVTYS